MYDLVDSRSSLLSALSIASGLLNLLTTLAGAVTPATPGRKLLLFIARPLPLLRESPNRATFYRNDRIGCCAVRSRSATPFQTGPRQTGFKVRRTRGATAENRNPPVPQPNKRIQPTRNIKRTERSDIFVGGDVGTKVFVPNGDEDKKQRNENSAVRSSCRGDWIRTSDHTPPRRVL